MPARQPPSYRKQAAGRAQNAHAGQTHDDTGQQYAAHAGDEDILELHVEDGRRQRTGPGTGAGQRDAHEEQQRHGQAFAGLFFQLAAALFALDDEEPADGADDRLVVAPDEEPPGEQIDERHRQHIAQHTDDVGGQHRQAQTQADGDGTAQLHHGHHRNEEDEQIVLEHGYSPLLIRNEWKLTGR